MKLVEKGKSSWKYFVENLPEEWQMLFNVEKYKFFAHSICTDGVSVSIQLKRSKRCDDYPSNSKKPRNQIDLYQYTEMYGIDTGERLMLGEIKINSKGERSTLKLKSSQFHHEAGKPQRKIKLDKFTNQKYADFSLKYLPELQAVWGQRKVARLPLVKYMQTEKKKSRR